MTQDIVSFMLRFVREAGEAQEARWRGMVQHVQSDAEQQFTQFSEAFAFIQEHVNAAARQAFADSATWSEMNPLLETARLWGEFVPQYNQIVIDAVADAVRSGAALPEQMQASMASLYEAMGVKWPEAATVGMKPSAETADQMVDALKKMSEMQAAMFSFGLEQMEKMAGAGKS